VTSASLFALLIAVRPGVVGQRLDAIAWLVVLTPATAVTVLLLSRLPSHPLTRALVVYVGSQLLSAGPMHLWQALAGDGGPVYQRVDNVLWLGGMPMLPLLVTLFPDGATGRRRLVVRAQVLALGGLALVTAVGRLDALAARIVLGALVTVLLVTAVTGVVLLVARAVRERATRHDLAPFATVTAIAVVLWFCLPSLERLVELPSGAGSSIPSLLVIGLPPVGLGYAVLRHQLFGLDVIVRRVAIAALVASALLAAYLGCALALASFAGVSRDALAPALLPAAVVAVLLLPGYRLAVRAADRRLYGDRRDPLALLSSLAEELAATTPEDVPQHVVGAVSDALRLPWVALEIDREGSWQRVAQRGRATPGATTAEFPLLHAGERPGRLLVEPRRGETELGRLDHRLLSQVAGQLGPAAAAIRLVDELTLSRERLVEGREAERARLRRELHDGLSPSLAGMSLAVTAARRHLREEEPAAADGLLVTVAAESTAAWQAVRSILDDLRPPGLDELGLVGALEQRARQLTRPSEFEVDVAVAADLPPLPPAVQTAAYRIVTEAMTNAARHSRAEHCRVRLCLDGGLHCTVEDDGTGITEESSTGIGLASMAERAAELGGSAVVVPAAGGGTKVVATLPLVLHG
jgi:signal transduction histidine kinase